MSQNHPQNLLETIIFSDIQNTFFLRATKLPPQTSSLNDLVQRSFGDSHYLGDHAQKTRQFYELILTDTQSADITQTTAVATPPTFYIKNALSKILWASTNGKIHYKKDNSLFHLNQPPIIILITKWPG